MARAKQLERERVSAVLIKIILALVFLAGSFSAPASAALQTPTAVGELQLSIVPRDDGKVVLLARLTNREGRAMGGNWVVFSLITDFFGERIVYLGRGFTDYVDGYAKLTYEPRVDGPHKFRAQYEPKDSGVIITEVEGALKAAVFPEEPHDSTLEWLNQNVGRGVLLLTIAIWITIWTVFFRVLLTIRRAQTERRTEE